MIQEAIKKLEALGCMADEYARLIKLAQKPINREEAKILIRLFPESGLFGIESSLRNLFESIYNKIPKTEYLSILEECTSEEWKETLRERVPDVE